MKMFELNVAHRAHAAARVLWALGLTFVVGCQTTQIPVEPANHVVILVDRSASFRARLQEAIAAAGTVVDQMSKTRLHRWEEDADRIVLVSVDAMPAVVWEGGLRSLKALDPAQVERLFLARASYDRCTNVGAAFRLAAEKLGEPADHVTRHVIAFTDLIDEPPTNAIDRCVKPKTPSLPAADFPWAELHGANVNVFWVPPSQLLSWTQAIQQQGLRDSFHLHSPEESVTASFAAPPRPELELSREEQERVRAEVIRSARRLGRGVTVGLVGIVAAIVMAGGIGIVVIRARRGRRAVGAARGGRRAGPASGFGRGPARPPMNAFWANPPTGARRPPGAASGYGRR